MNPLLVSAAESAVARAPLPQASSSSLLALGYAAWVSFFSSRLLNFSLMGSSSLFRATSTEFFRSPGCTTCIGTDRRVPAPVPPGEGERWNSSYCSEAREGGSGDQAGQGDKPQLLS